MPRDFLLPLSGFSLMTKNDKPVFIKESKTEIAVISKVLPVGENLGEKKNDFGKSRWMSGDIKSQIK